MEKVGVRVRVRSGIDRYGRSVDPARPKRLIGRGTLALARGSLEHDLALGEASGEPAGRGLSQLVFHLGVNGAPLRVKLTMRRSTGPKTTRLYECYIRGRKQASAGWLSGGCFQPAGAALAGHGIVESALDKGTLTLTLTPTLTLTQVGLRACKKESGLLSTKARARPTRRCGRLLWAHRRGPRPSAA